jgi:hypothetical protein
MWTVYERPKDYPDGFAARRFSIGNGTFQKTDQCIFGATLDSVRWALCQLSPGMTRLPRDERDEPQIIETWM